MIQNRAAINTAPLRFNLSNAQILASKARKTFSQLTLSVKLLNATLESIVCTILECLVSKRMLTNKHSLKMPLLLKIN